MAIPIPETLREARVVFETYVERAHIEIGSATTLMKEIVFWYKTIPNARYNLFQRFAMSDRAQQHKKHITLTSVNDLQDITARFAETFPFEELSLNCKATLASIKEKRTTYTHLEKQADEALEPVLVTLELLFPKILEYTGRDYLRNLEIARSQISKIYHDAVRSHG